MGRGGFFRGLLVSEVVIFSYYCSMSSYLLSEAHAR